MYDLELLSDFSLFLKEKKQEGFRIAAFLAHDNIPEEILDAGGFFPLRLIFAGNDELMDASHDYLPPSTCAFAQSCIGLFSVKPNQFNFLEQIDHIIVSNHCVSDICASEVISKYFNIPRINFYVSYTKNENSLEYYRLELQDLLKQLESIIGKKIAQTDILESLMKYNEFKKVLSELNKIQCLGSVKLKIIQKALLFGPSILDWIKLEVEKLKAESFQIPNDAKNVILTGCSLFINDELINLIEEGGGNVIFFDTWIGNHYFSQVIEQERLNTVKDPLDLLVLRYKENIYGDHSVPNFLDNKVAYLEKYYDEFQETESQKLGIINHIIKFCDHMSLMSSFLKTKLFEKGINVLNLERDYSKANRGQLLTRIEAFLEMI